MQGFHFLNLDLTRYTSASCLVNSSLDFNPMNLVCRQAKVNYYDSLLTMVLFPPALLLVLAMVYFVIVFVRYRIGNLVDPLEIDQLQAGRKRLWRQFVKVGSQILERFR